MNILTPSLPPVPRVAVIELSSTAVKLLIGKDSYSILRQPFSFKLFARQSYLTYTHRLLDDNLELNADGFASVVLPEIQKSLALISRFSVDVVEVIATAAYRKAANRAQILQLIKHHTGLDTCVLTQEEEALATFDAFCLSTAYGKQLSAHPYSLVIDQGGGSTELALYHNRQLLRCDSLNIGSEVLRKSFFNLLYSGDTDFALSKTSANSHALMQPFIDFCRENVANPDDVFTIGLGKSLSHTSGDPKRKIRHDTIFTVKKLLDDYCNADIAVRHSNPFLLATEPMLTVRLGLDNYLHLCRQLGQNRIVHSGTGLWYAIFYQILNRLAR